MKWIPYLIIFFLYSCANVANRLPATTIIDKHIVFDIDWSIVSEIKKPTPYIIKNPRVIKVYETYYFINEGLEEFIEDILSHPEIKVSFYSGGNSIRNNELLSKIKLKNGRSLSQIAYKVLSREDLVSVEAVSGAPFAERFKKDLTKISKNLEQLIMFDDNAKFTIENGEDQSRHVFFIGKAFEYFDKFKDAKNLSGEYIPKNYDEWLLDRKKLNILHAVFNESYDESVESDISLSEAMKKREELLNLKDHEWNSQISQYYRKYKKKDIQHGSSSSSLNCHEIAKILIGL